MTPEPKGSGSCKPRAFNATFTSRYASTSLSSVIRLNLLGFGNTHICVAPMVSVCFPHCAPRWLSPCSNACFPRIASAGWLILFYFLNEQTTAVAHLELDFIGLYRRSVDKFRHASSGSPADAVPLRALLAIGKSRLMNDFPEAIRGMRKGKSCTCRKITPD